MMKAIVVYDSKWGNTEKIAHAIAAGIGFGTKSARTGDSLAMEFEKYDLLVIGSPVLGGRPSEAIQTYIKGIPQTVAARIKAAAFDTRLTMRFAKLFGHASKRMADALKAKGIVLKSEPKGFIVMGRSGPLANGEIERATQWGKELAEL
jgi:flavodoxin